MNGIAAHESCSTHPAQVEPRYPKHHAQPHHQCGNSTAGFRELACCPKEEPRIGLTIPRNSRRGASAIEVVEKRRERIGKRSSHKRDIGQKRLLRAVCFYGHIYRIDKPAGIMVNAEQRIKLRCPPPMHSQLWHSFARIRSGRRKVNAWTRVKLATCVKYSKSNVSLGVGQRARENPFKGKQAVCNLGSQQIHSGLRP